MKNDYKVTIKYKPLQNKVILIEAANEEEAINLASKDIICPDEVESFKVKFLKKSQSL
jgi:hypothetical protein